MAEKFRKVKPLWLDEQHFTGPDAEIGPDRCCLWLSEGYMGIAWSVEEARALHKWLSKALPKEMKK